MHSMTDSVDTHIERVLSTNGGKRKRAHIQYGGDEMKDSHVCNFWGKHWGLKGYPAHFFLEQAKKICKDSGKNTHASIAKLASSSGSAKNPSRGFRRAVNQCASCPKVSFVTIVVLDTKSEGCPITTVHNMSHYEFIFDDECCTQPCHCPDCMADDEGCLCTSREHMTKVEEWVYINHNLKIPNCTIYFDMSLEENNVMFFSKTPTIWHGQMVRFGKGLMTVTFNYKGDINNMHTALMKKKSMVRYVGEDDKQRRITMRFKGNSFYCPKCEVWTQ